MMRDYKFQQSTLPLRTQRRGGRKIVLKSLGILMIAVAGYAAFQWYQSLPQDNAPQIQTNDRIIPLQLPPIRSSTTEPVSAGVSNANP